MDEALSSKQRRKFIYAEMAKAHKAGTGEAIRDLLAATAFNDTFDHLSPSRQKICLKYAKMHIDNTDTNALNSVSMTNEEREAAELYLESLLKKKADLEAECAQRARKLDKQIKDVEENLGAKGKSPATAERLQLLRKPKYEAARWALEKLSKPATLSEMMAVLREHGYGVNYEPGALRNALYVGIKRKPSEFRMDRETEKWSLAEWDEK